MFDQNCLYFHEGQLYDTNDNKIASRVECCLIKTEKHLLKHIMVTKEELVVDDTHSNSCVFALWNLKLVGINIIADNVIIHCVITAVI